MKTPNSEAGVVAVEPPESVATTRDHGMKRSSQHEDCECVLKNASKFPNTGWCCIGMVSRQGGFAAQINLLILA